MAGRKVLAQNEPVCALDWLINDFVGTKSKWCRLGHTDTVKLSKVNICTGVVDVLMFFLWYCHSGAKQLTTFKLFVSIEPLNSEIKWFYQRIM